MLRYIMLFCLVVTAKPAVADTPFEVEDLPKVESTRGLLGEEGAPSLDEQRKKLAHSLLTKGICMEDYYGVEFCKRNAAQTSVMKPVGNTALRERDLLGTEVD